MPRKKLSEAERIERIKESKRRWKAKEKAKRGGSSPSASPSKTKPASWLKEATRKLEAAAESMGPDEGEEKPPERSGEPFADLPPLDLPSTPESPAEATATPEDSATDAGRSQTGSASGSSADTSSPTPKVDPKAFDTDMMQKMAYGLGVMYMEKTAEFCAERKFFAFDASFAPMVGMACSVIVKRNAEKFNVDDEEGAAYVIGIFGGVNGVQAIRAAMEEHNRKKAEIIDVTRTSAAAKQQEQHVNGVTRAEQQQQSQAERDRARDDAARTGGSVV